jgi:polyisoprenyl-phosphate glycosyltransferase
MAKLSILVPVYFNEQNLPRTISALLGILDQLAPSMEGEIIFTDDGSLDASFRVLKEYAQKDSRVKVVKLSRNFGAYIALQAALDAATGDCYAVIMADLQDPPELILKMVDAWKNGYRIVIASRQDRHDPFLNKILAQSFWWFMKKYAIKTLPAGGFDFVCFDRIIADVLRASPEKNSHFMLRVLATGFPYFEIPYVRHERDAGKSRWTLSKRIKLFIDSAIAFSYIPVRTMSVIGIVTACIGFLMTCFWIAQRIFFGIPIQGWTSLMVILLVIGGIQMIMLGLIGEYIWRTFDETRKRPTYIVDQRINLEE